MLCLLMSNFAYAESDELKTTDQSLQDFAAQLLKALQDKNMDKMFELHAQKMTYQDWLETWKLFKKVNRTRMSDEDVSYAARKSFKNHCYDPIEKAFWQKLYPEQAETDKSWKKWQKRTKKRRANVTEKIEKILKKIKKYEIDLQKTKLTHIEFKRKKDQTRYPLHTPSDVKFFFTDQSNHFALEVDDLLKTSKAVIIDYSIKFRRIKK